MRRIDLYFNNILSHLEELQARLIDYYDENSHALIENEQKGDRYTEFSSGVDSLLDILKESFQNNEIIDDLSIITPFLEELETFNTIFFDFNINKTELFRLILSLIAKVNDVIENDIDIDFDIDISNYEIVDLTTNLIEGNFVLFKSEDLTKSVVIYDPNGDTFSSFLNNDFHSAHIDLLLIWINLLTDENSSILNQLCLYRKLVNLDLRDLHSVLKLQVLAKGERLKSLQTYYEKPKEPFSNSFDYNENYRQFDSIANVLNEYNNHIYVLDKYLKLYHIIENFMYKHKICRLEREKNGIPFHIRDFQILYDRFKVKEIECIQDFFKDVLQLNNNTDKFINVLVTSWESLEIIDSTKIPHINTLFIQLGFKTSTYNYERIKANLDHSMFSLITYKIRNAIVHNKDSENHFESINLPEGAKFLLENFLIPNLEKIVFHLIINKNDLVWYENNHLLLYEN